MSTELNAMIENLVVDNADQDTIFTAIAKETGKGILNAVSIYKRFMKESGRLMSADTKRQIVSDAIADAKKNGNKVLKEPEAVAAVISEKLNIDGVAAMRAIKRAAKGGEFSLPTRTTVVNSSREWFVSNPNASKEEFSKWVTDSGFKESKVTSLWGQFTFAKECFSAWA